MESESGLLDWEALAMKLPKDLRPLAASFHTIQGGKSHLCHTLFIPMSVNLQLKVMPSSSAVH